MSRSGYSEDYEHMELYRANVDRTLAGKKGQAFLIIPVVDYLQPGQTIKCWD
jgi:hypothetical protein